jgi:hypothetical protein
MTATPRSRQLSEQVPPRRLQELVARNVDSNSKTLRFDCCVVDACDRPFNTIGRHGNRGQRGRSLRIQDVLRSYVWANDSGSVEAVVAAFIPDGIVQLATGERTPVRGWAIETFAQPGRRGHR